MPARRRATLALGLVAWLLAGDAAAEGVSIGETVDPKHLRVCADPANMPLSDRQGEGFENRIAERLAEHLGVPVAYTWHPQSMGFVRNTLRARRCDIIIGVVAADEQVQNTNPYYRSSWMLVHRAADGARFDDLSAPSAAEARIGMVATSPPADLVQRLGIIARARSYQLLTDTSVDQPIRRMMADLADGELDVALVWGPIAGWWAKQQAVPLAMVPLPSDPRTGLRFDFRISMGIRTGEPDWKHKINGALRELQPDFDRILDEFAVPRLDNRGRLVGVWSSAEVAEPDGYRMGEYRAPVPKTLRGATVLDATGLARLVAERQPVLVDVMPRPRKPEGRPDDKLWLEPRRDDIPGSVWLPNSGLGELPPETAAWMASRLEALTGGDKARPLVFYCARNCWMSWNAARRAVVEFGYTAVHWYPDGPEGWSEAGHLLAEAVPEQGP
ncbi:MAG TPA: quinoprotein dehydrogenase-associated putative ABC transporter substrate-binding protein [Geminicoccaceae bacterium]|nr:quinoprotein dehydrogenase-associated putative ABC transporter substrate-binding protein [Geminicoccus sp.]HMU52161.1 quinoprotein dehydrogenase-associated putative ABC transporter substrate-binding protein [Geminicoccaceae bacterium]